ncbi:accessory gene regulator B family protein [Natroniella sulfidigena]|uniref:accessory gene regulator ArgB-like protein n=1 Tax=Natroniella sulfidigena TaxID=723921 RepID=UPI00200A0D5E|nr:accessory gene regulator B family protein [Natroniella sulfidigena]MCK8817404.1 accessory gene regulator B family protein [Natroniella sulfidigena]
MVTKDRFELMSEKLIDRIFTESSDQEKAVLDYGLQVVLSSLLNYLFIIIISSLLGVRTLALTAAITASLIKVFSGGVHASCLRNCVLTAVTIFTSIGLISKYVGPILGENVIIFFWLVLLVGFLVLYLYAPVGVKEKPITSQAKRSKLKRYSFIVFFTFQIVYYLLYLTGTSASLILAGLLGACWQLFGITPVAYRLFGREYRKEVKEYES